MMSAKAEEGMVTNIYGGSAGPNTIAIGDSIVVRTENLDGWLISKIEKGYLNDDPFVTKYWKDYGLLILTEDFDWDELLDAPTSVEIQKKYGAVLEALRKKTAPDSWRSSVVEARGSWNGFLRRKASELKLVIDDVHFDNLKPEVVELIPFPDDQPGPTVFHSSYRLTRNADNNGTWHELLHEFKFKRPVRLTLGLATTNGTWLFMPTKIVPSADPRSSPLQLRLVSLWRFLAAVATITCALAVFLRLARTDLVRDVDALPRPAGNAGELVYPVSLARSQMAFWFFLVMAAYLFIWLTTERLDGLNEQMLALIGISAGTALGAAFVTAGKGPPRTVAQEQAHSLDPAIPATEREAASRRAARLVAQQEWLLSSSPYIRLLDDWLTEDGVTSFHRFQMLAWTIVLGLIFVAHVCSSYAMPEFSATMLALLGISSGTYLGFKLPDTR